MAIPNTIIELKIKDVNTGSISVDPVKIGIDFNNPDIQESISNAVGEAGDQLAISEEEIASLFEKIEQKQINYL